MWRRYDGVIWRGPAGGTPALQGKAKKFKICVQLLVLMIV